MVQRNVLLKLASLLVVVLLLAALPAASYARGLDRRDTLAPVVEIGTSSPITLPPAGEGSLVFTNFNGGGDELTVALLGVTYKVPANTNGEPTWTQVFLPPGTYSYTGSVPVVGDVNNTIDVQAGQITQLGFVVNGGQTLVDVSTKPAQDNRRTEITIIAGDLFVYTADITGRAR